MWLSHQMRAVPLFFSGLRMLIPGPVVLRRGPSRCSRTARCVEPVSVWRSISLWRSKVSQCQETDPSYASESTATLTDGEFVPRANGFTPMKWLKFKPTKHIPQHLNWRAETLWVITAVKSQRWWNKIIFQTQRRRVFKWFEMKISLLYLWHRC